VDLQKTGFLVPVTLLWLAGNALRLTVLAVPPVMQLIKTDLGLTATEVGVLASIPIVLFAAAALPGSLLIARLGPVRAVVAGLLLSALGSGLRGAATGALSLYAATVLVGCGVAVMQPAMPALVRQWLPTHVGFGTAVYTNGLLVGEILAVSLTLPVVLPLSGGSWRLSLLAWGMVVVAIAGCILALSPPPHAATTLPRGRGARWWPDWSNGLIWRLGVIFGSANSIYFASNAFLPVYLAAKGRNDAIGPALTALNLGQLPASFLLLAVADRIAGRSWPYAVSGLLASGAVLGVVFAPGAGTIGAAAVLGFAAAGTLVLTLALPPLLCRPEEIAAITAAMFTMSYGSAVVTPIISGVAWDVTGSPAMAFLPMGLWAVLLLCVAPVMSLRRA
jgi:CP family cyanate transporter-like MFS transporter